MKKHHLISILLLTLPFWTFAIPNSQSAKLLEAKEMEFSYGLRQSSTIYAAVASSTDNSDFYKSGVYFALPISIGGSLSSAFNLRAGINELVEYQFQGGISNRFYFGPFINYYTLFVPDFKVYAKTGVKIKLFNGSKIAGSLLTTAGLAFLIEPILNFFPITPVSAPYSTNITFEITPLFDIATTKSSNVIYYFGFPIRLEYSLFEINLSGTAGFANVRRSFPNTSVEFLFGIENTKHSVIARHEFFFKYTLHTYSAFNGEIENNVFSNDWEICGTEHVFSTGYSISIGGRTKRK